MRNACEARAGFRYPAQTRVPTRFRRGRWARSRQALLVVSILQQHSVAPGTVHCCCCDVVSCAIRTKLMIRKSAGLLALTSDLQQQRSSIMMHPSGHPPARRQRCSHAPIPSRQPHSACTSTWSAPCVVTYRPLPRVLPGSSESSTLSVLCLHAKSAQ